MKILYYCLCINHWNLKSQFRNICLSSFRIELLFTSTVLGGNEEWIEQLKEWLPSEVQDKKMKLCYRASVNGWASSTFHSFCDSKGPTVVLVKSGQYVFGGYAAAQWGGKFLSLKIVVFFSFIFSNCVPNT
jgi:hypothetical protein